jgi:hypothetical protein
MVLSTHVRLDTLPVFRSTKACVKKGMYNKAQTKDLPFVNVPSGTVTSDKADRLYARVITDGIYRWDSPVYDVNDAWGESCPLAEFSNDHCRTGVSLGGL